MADFRELEKLVAAIQKQLAPASDVQHNVKLDGRRSGVKRQIDVLVSQKVGQYEIRIIIDCKDHKHPIDVKGVEEFYGLFDDVGAQKGVLVCPTGFTKAAKNLAQDRLLDLYSPIDTGLHKWRAKPVVPVICDFRKAAIGFGIQCSAPYPFRMNMDFFSANVAYDAIGNELGTAAGTAVRRWNEGEYPIEAGEHNGVLDCELGRDEAPVLRSLSDHKDVWLQRRN
jgi:Restriction endonuclease